MGCIKCLNREWGVEWKKGWRNKNFRKWSMLVKEVGGLKGEEGEGGRLGHLC